MIRRTQVLLAFTTAAAVVITHTVPPETLQEKPLAIVGEPTESDHSPPHDEREEYSNERNRVRASVSPAGAPPPKP